MLPVCQMREREGFSIIQKSPCLWQRVTRAATTSLSWFAARTLTRPVPAREAKPSGNPSPRRGFGSGAPWARKRLLMGFSRALEKVPQGGPKCAKLECTSAGSSGSSWTAAANPSVVVRKVVDVGGGLLAVSIEGVIHSNCVETSVDEGRL